MLKGSHKLCHRYVCIGGGKHSIHRVPSCPWFQASTRGLGTYPPQIRGDYCTKENSSQISHCGGRDLQIWKDNRNEPFGGGSVMEASIFLVIE